MRVEGHTSLPQADLESLAKEAHEKFALIHATRNNVPVDFEIIGQR